MKVKELISELKKMPKDLQVGVAMHDNNNNEIAAWVSYVDEIIETDYFTKEGKRCVSLRC